MTSKRVERPDQPEKPRESAIATNLGLMLRRYRILGEKTMREAAKEVGINASTWHRLEHGYMPDADTFVRMLAWMLRDRT